MIKRYSLPSEQIAKELIALLSEEPSPTVTEFTHGIVCLGFNNVYEYKEETEESILVKKGLTYDVDVFWKGEANEDWTAYEIHPKTPNHKFS